MAGSNSPDYSEWNENSNNSSIQDAVSSEDAYWDDDEWNRMNANGDLDAGGIVTERFAASRIATEKGARGKVEVHSTGDSDVDVESTSLYDGPDADSGLNPQDDKFEDGDSAEYEYPSISVEEFRDDSQDLASDPQFRDDEPLDVIIETDVPTEYEPLLTRWIAGLAASLILHLWIISTLSSISVDDRAYETALAFDSKIEWEDPEPEPEPVLEKPITEFELANPDDVEKEQHVALNASSVGLIQSEKPVQESAPRLEVDTEVAMGSSAPVFDIPEGLEIDETIVIQGTTGEGIIQMDAALDRVTWEIAANLKERKLLVVWLIDSSASLSEQRKVVAKRMRRIYSELNALEAVGQIPNQDQPLLSAVVTFGQGSEFLTPNPTTNVDEIVSKLERAPMDQSGVENVFGAVRKVVEKWSSLRRRILVMTITDEAGDDFAQHLNAAISMLNRTASRAYVIGPPAVFGKRQGFVPYLAPENGQTYQIPVDIGPESAMGQNVQLPFWFGGPQYENLSSGLGPYALARLVHETGGVYFMTNMTTAAGLTPTGTYAAQTMKLFAPDYRFGTTDEYLRDVSKHPIRAAVHRAHELSLKYKALGTPELELRVNPNNYIQTLATAQQTVAISTAMIDEILTAFPPSLEQAYLKEESPRWRMSYNLSFGRLLAQRLRCMEYNTALAQLKLLGTQDITTKVNHFIFRPDPSINYAAGMKKPKDLSETLLKRCVNEAPGTPWAVLAARELQYPFGVKVIQKFEPPPPPPSAATAVAAANTKKKGILLLADDTKKKKQAPVAPPPPPKLPRF